jgi:hypothetical protein
MRFRDWYPTPLEHLAILIAVLAVLCAARALT